MAGNRGRIRTDLVRLMQGRRERRRRDLTRSLRELSSALDLKTVLTELARQAAEALGAIDGVIMIRRGEDLRTYSSTQVEPLANAMGRGAFANGRELPSVYVMRTGDVLAVDDVSRYDGPPGFEDACRIAGVRSALCVPIRPWNEPNGVLNLGFGRTKHFRRGDIAFASEYAEEAAAALERARVIELEDEARSALTEFDELKFNFLTNVANDLQTPLTSILGFSDVLLEQGEAISAEKRHDMVARISSQAHALASIVDDLLEARGTAAKAGPSESLDLRLLVINAVDSLTDAAGHRKFEIQIPDGWNVLASGSAAGRVLLSLLTNAVQFSPEDSTVTITAMKEERFAIVSVRDEGIGLAEEDHERIFDSFYRVQRTDSAVRGTGIGLSIARSYVKAMGGEMWVTSTPGEGSTFWFTLKLAPRSNDEA